MAIDPINFARTTQVRLRRGTTEQIAANPPVEAEPFYDLTTQRMGIGGGSDGIVEQWKSEFLEHTADDANAVSRNLQDKLDEVLSVKDFGAIGDGVTDDTEAIQAALNASSKAVVPKGTYRVTDSIVIDFGKHLHLNSGATIKGESATPKPVIRIYGAYSRLTGDGYTSVVTTNNVTGGLSSWTDEGIINFGSLNESTGINTNWAMISDIRVVGNGARSDAYFNSLSSALDNDIAIKMVNPQVFSSFSASLYNSNISNVMFEHVGIGVDCEPVVQGNTFHNLFFYKVSKYGFRFVGAGENSINQTFFHFCPGITFVHIGTSSAGLPYFASRPTEGISATNLTGEPGSNGPAITGSRNSSFCYIESGNNNNFLMGRGNTGHAFTDLGDDNTIFNLSSAKLGALFLPNGFTSSDEYIQNGLISHDGAYKQSSTDVGDVFQTNGSVKKRLGGYPLFGTGDKKKLATFSINSPLRSFVVKVTANYGYVSASVSSWNSEEFVFGAFRGSSSSASAVILYRTKQSSSSSLCDLEVVGDTVTIAFSSGHPGVRVVLDVEITGGYVVGGTIGDFGGFTLTQLDGTDDSTANVKSGPGFYSYQPTVPGADNTLPLGSATLRWSEVFAGTGTINTSDAREKEAIAELSEAEKAVASDLKASIKTFKYSDSVQLKGDYARIHVGVIAQEVKSIFESHGLTAEDYGILCIDEWYELNGCVVSADEETGEYPDGAVKKDRYGVRYEELLAFIISAI